jgi:hypothetical protein
MVGGRKLWAGARSPRTGATATSWLAWTAATTLGLLLGARFAFGLLETLSVPVPRGPWSDGINVAALGAVAGGVLGACQAVVVARRLGRRGALAWVAATAAGAGLALGLARGGDGLFRLIGLAAAFDAVGAGVWRGVALALLGAGVGVGQWLVLRRRVGRALWWVPACIAATLVTWFLLSPRTGVPWWVTLALFGGVTGVVLVALLRGEPDAAPQDGAVA